MKINNTLKLVISIIVSEMAGIIGSVFTTPSIAGWYATLVKPSFNPPAWVFGPVWTTLFAMMGVALFLVWKNQTVTSKKMAYRFFFIQLILNVIWSIVFFYHHNPGGALIEIVFLWLAILATIIFFAKISRPAAWLLAPYILWVSFAGFLNYSIWQLNSSASTDISDWKTYQNNTYGFETKYPKNYSEFHSDGDSGIDLRTIKECDILTHVGGGEWPTDCQVYDISIQQNKVDITGPGIDVSQIVLDGIQAQKITAVGLGMFDNMTQVVVYFQKEQNWYIQTFTFNSNKTQPAEEVMNQILASFRFVK